MLEPADIAPDFQAVTTDGDTVSLASNRGHYVVLYFYPTDDTAGCTREACSFRDAREEFRDAGAVIYGVSVDDQQSHKAFSDKYSLNFPLLVDTDGTIAEAYGVPRSPSGVTRRVTFLIGPDGTILRTWPRVDIDVHAAEVLGSIRSCQPA